MFFLALTSLILVWSWILTTALVMFNAGDRFRLPQLETQVAVASASGSRVWPFLLMALAAVPLLVSPLLPGDFKLDSTMRTTMVTMLILGSIVAYFVAYGGLLVA